ncbi:gdsl esterase/lipase 1 [Quercus suber]|uniref:Gdsl esterase/lipase 1 n=1 Tax=Quercus suber TaxID=58331 RepID=A0AAW0LNS5_QUESU
MKSLRFYFCFLVLYASISFPTKCFSNICLPKDHVAFFIFGDSIVDVGNNNYITTNLQANFFPYGETFFKFPTGRASNGRLIPDFIAERANLPLIPPYLYPGAGVLAETRRGLVIDLNTQLNYFKNMETLLKHKLGEEEANTLLVKAVYLICIGSNDYFVPFNINSSVLKSYSPKKYVNMVIGNLTTAIKEIYKKGGRKYVFLGLPPAGCAPSIKAQIPGNTGACMEELTALAKLHNIALSKVLPKLESQLKGFKYSLADFYSFFIERINSFTEGKIACCGSGPYGGIPSRGERSNEYELCEKVSNFLFFDSVHPTEKAYQQFAELIWSGTPNITGPYNLKALFEMKSLRFYFCFLVLYASISFPTKCFSNICLPKDHVAFFIFGDSIVDVGNNNYITTNLQANFFPYGETFFHYPTGRASNGRLIPDFIAERANLPLIQPYLYPGYDQYIDGANFASIGAGVLAETRRGLVIDLNTQLNYFKNTETLLKHKLGEEEAKTLLVKAVYLLCIGNNDYLSPSLQTPVSLNPTLQKNM